MKRIAATPRHDLAAIVAREGFTHATIHGEPYWDESAFYAFTVSEIETLEAATEDLSALCLAFAGRVIGDDSMLDRLGIHRAVRPLIRRSWDALEPSLYGRFDLAFDGAGPPKLLEYNADTPTTLYESSVFQWLWLEDSRTSGMLPKDADQFNSLHEALIARWRDMAMKSPIHFAAMSNVEDEGTIAYLAETARAAGHKTTLMTLRDIGLRRGSFVDLSNIPIASLFKLYPWEWLLEDRFGSETAAIAAMQIVEPAWKMLLSTKAILPLLWEMAPGHPNLLPACFAGEPGGADVGPRFVKKLCLSREGANVTLIDHDTVLAETGGSYRGRAVLQTMAAIPDFDGNHPVIGSWVVGERACGIGIREDMGLITSNTSRFVPHAIVAAS